MLIEDITSVIHRMMSDCLSSHSGWSSYCFSSSHSFVSTKGAFFSCKSKMKLVFRDYNIFNAPKTRYLKIVTDIIASSKCISKKVGLSKTGRVSVIKAVYHPEAAIKVLVALVLINSVSLFLSSRGLAMGKGCITVTKYFLFLFNLLFFVSNWVYLSMVMVVKIWFLMHIYGTHSHRHLSFTLSSFIYSRHKNYGPSDSVWFIGFIFHVAPQISDDAESTDSAGCKTR